MLSGVIPQFANNPLQVVLDGGIVEGGSVGPGSVDGGNVDGDGATVEKVGACVAGRTEGIGVAIGIIVEAVGPGVTGSTLSLGPVMG
jgi:hypothetical protein